MTVSRMTTPCTFADCAIGGYIALTSLTLIGGITPAPTRTGLSIATPSRIQAAGGGGGGGGGGDTPRPAVSRRRSASGVPCTSSRVSEPRAKRRATSNETGASAGGSYTHLRTASIAALAKTFESETPAPALVFALA